MRIHIAAVIPVAIAAAGAIAWASVGGSKASMAFDNVGKLEPRVTKLEAHDEDRSADIKEMKADLKELLKRLPHGRP